MNYSVNLTFPAPLSGQYALCAEMLRNPNGLLSAKWKKCQHSTHASSDHYWQIAVQLSFTLWRDQ